MAKDFSQLSAKEQLEAENDFIKMKLMLEKGAEFGGGGDKDLNPEIENFFLKNVMEFERQFDERKTIKVFDKIGKPSGFKPVAQIPDEEIDKAWKSLSSYLFKNGISLGVCSPNVPPRELYRFTTEELFQYEMDDVVVPGIFHGFIYDEFYPDIAYDNTRIAEDDCINSIFRKGPMEWTHYYRNENLRLNQHHPLKIEEFKNMINWFKAAYDELEPDEITGINCVVGDRDCRVEGKYSLTATTSSESCRLSGNWKVVFEKDVDSGCWYIQEVQIENVNF
jgi:hypothetical protein